MILGPKVGVVPSFVAKIVGNNYCTETSVQPATVEVREYSTRVSTDSGRNHCNVGVGDLGHLWS